MQTYILGIDAGATKTEAVIADLSGKILFSQKGDQASWDSGEGSKTAINNIKATVSKLILKSGIKNFKAISTAVGMAGLNCPEDQEIASGMLRKTLKKYLAGLFWVGNDVLIVRRSVSQSSFGVALIAGTGTNCYGMNLQGKEARSAGLGHFLADQGGGYWMGLQILLAAAKSFDSRGPKTVLEEMVMRHFGVKHFLDLLGIVYGENFGKKQIASLSCLMDPQTSTCHTEDKILKKDKVYQKIIDQACQELVMDVKAVVDKLKMSGKAFDLVVGGSILVGKPTMRKCFSDKIKNRYHKAHILYVEKGPVQGAVNLALDKL